jgi:acetyl esterase/lipase
LGQLDAVPRRLLAKLASQAPLLAGAGVLAFIDMARCRIGHRWRPGPRTANGTAREFLGILMLPRRRARCAGVRRSRPGRGPASGTRAWARLSADGKPRDRVLVTSDFENCPFLNVYTPGRELGRRLLPVMVWIHGGGVLTGGTGSIYDGKIIAARAGASS